MSKTKYEPKHKNWVFTAWEDDEPINHVDNLNWKYLAYSHETCPTTGRKHWQSYICLKTDITWNSFKKKVPKEWRFDFMKGKLIDNERYCSKEAELIEHGELPKQGKRNDLDEVRGMRTMREVTAVASSYQAVRMMEVILKYHEEPRTWKPTVKWFYGSTGTGKTRAAVEEAGNEFWISLRDGKWFEGYDGHENVIFDDVRGDFMKYHEWLRILDRYAYRVEVKGSSRQFLAKNIWITSCYHPSEMFRSKTSEDMGQLLRRIDEIRQFGDEVLETKSGVILGPDFRDSAQEFGDLNFQITEVSENSPPLRIAGRIEIL